MTPKQPDRPRRVRTAIPDPYVDETTAPVDVDEMQAAATLSAKIADPDEVGPRPHVVRRAAGSSPDGTMLPYAELRIAGGAAVRLPVRQVTRTGVALEIPPEALVDAEGGVAVTADLYLGADVNGQAIRAKLPALVAHLRKATPTQPGGISLRWDLQGPGARETLNLLLDRIAPPG
jgi:hypothetical protein